MPEFWVGIRGELTDEQIATLKGAGGIAVDDLRAISGGFGFPPQWETLRTCVRVSAADKADARVVVAETLGSDVGDLVAYSAEIFR